MQLRLIAPLLLFVVLIFFFSVGLKKDPNLLPSMLMNKPLPKLVISTLDGQSYSLTDANFKTKVTLLNVWATWCDACQIEQPFLMDLAKNQQLQLLGLDYKDNRATAKKYLQKNGNPYQQVLFDGEGKYAMALGIYGTPETFLIDKKGIVRHRYVGPITLDVLEKDLLPRISAIQGEN
jgi:cytochrome c biogenesis protein CcmG, thiol:disulfide interchange protein DsbE